MEKVAQMSELYIVGISTSPRQGGNTDLLLDETLRGAASMSTNKIEKISLRGLHIGGCTHCDECYRVRRCVIRDDMDFIYPKLIEADRLIIAAPIYFMGVCAQAKLLIDRCQVFWVQNRILKEPQPTPPKKRIGSFISVGATRGPKVFAGACETMKWFFKTLGLEYSENLLYDGIDDKGAIRQHPSALRDAYELGLQLVQPV
jgi:multimeric flavodoxin WrbA